MIHSYLYLSASISLFLSFSFAAALSVTQSFTCSFSPTLFLPFSFSSTLSRHLAHSLCLILILFLDGTCAKTRIHTFTLTHSPLHTYAHTHTLTPNHSSISQKTSSPLSVISQCIGCNWASKLDKESIETQSIFIVDANNLISSCAAGINLCKTLDSGFH